MAKINMTEGNLAKNIIAYTVPIILTSLLQLLFNAADLIVVGQFCGGSSVGAVGATNSLTSLITNFFIGLSVGSGVSVAHAAGAGNKYAQKRTVGASMAVAVVCGLIVSAVGFFGSDTFLSLMGTPDEIIELSSLYMKVYYAGAVVVLIYNFGASILRAVGETKKPLLFLGIAGVLNVVLNIVFVTVFNMDVAGVALATILSQTLSAALVVIELTKRTDACRLVIKEIRFYKNETVKILKIGVPTGIQSSIFCVSNVLIQSGINSFGISAVSGSAASSSIESFTYASMNAFQQTAMNFTGQNVGANNIKRVRKIFSVCMIMVTLTGVLVGGVTYAFGESLLSVYVGNDSAAVGCGMTRLLWIVLPYFLCGIMEVSTGVLRGMGISVTPMITAISGVCIFRIGWQLTVFNLPVLHSLSGLFMSYPVSWIVTGGVNVIIYLVLIGRFEKWLRVRQ